MLKPDLHIHTTASDGVLAPSKVVLRAAEHGVNLIAVSDHDSLAGIQEAQSAADKVGIALVSAVEFSCGGAQEVHMLGYGLDPACGEIASLLEKMRYERAGRADKIVAKLSALGLPLEEEEIPAAKNAVKGRAQIARAMLAKGYVATLQEAFDRYIGAGCPAYVPRERLEVTDAIRLILRNGGVPVLAHPGLLRMDIVSLNAAMQSWMSAGLMGIEAYHPAHHPDAFALWDRYARARGLLVTGGSDFHEPGDKHADIGEMIPYWSECDKDASRLMTAMREAGRK